MVSSLPIEVSSCGKAIIVGEHAVVYGSSAVAMPLPSMQMHIRLSPSKGNKNTLKLGNNKISDHVLGIIDDAFQALGMDKFPVDVEGSSQVLIGSGLGSSAALSIVILKALASLAGKQISEHTLAQLGRSLEARFHGKSSGLDTAVVAYESIIQFKIGTEPKRLKVLAPKGHTQWNFALIDSRTRSSTLAMINQASPYFLDPHKGNKRLEEFDGLAATTASALEHGKVDLLAGAMNRASIMLGEAGLTSHLLSEMLDAIKSSGIPAAKLTGAGGGGCILALLEPSLAGTQLAHLGKIFGKDRVYAVNIDPSSYN
ncbi:MAG: mevalonate kinase [Oligoflexales bacterium]|nr:mevalonate kinase [Oligoflexales bacterium]